MKEFYRKSELIIEGLAITLTTEIDRAFVLVELNNVETFKDAEGIEQISVQEGGVTTALDYEEIDEIISLLKEVSDVLKRSESR